MNCGVEVAVSLHTCDSSRGARFGARRLCAVGTCLWRGEQHPPLPGCGASLLACRCVGTGSKEHLLGEILRLRSAWKVNLDDSHFQQ